MSWESIINQDFHPVAKVPKPKSDLNVKHFDIFKFDKLEFLFILFIF